MHNSGFISSQNRSGQVEKERKKKLSFRSFLHDPERDGTGQVEKEKKKIIVPILPARPRIENSNKKGQKNSKN